MSVHTLLRRLSFRRVLHFVEASATQRCLSSNYAEETVQFDEPPDLRRQKSPRKHLTPLLRDELGIGRRGIAEFLKNGGLELNKKLLMERLSFLRLMGFDDEEIKSELSILFVPSASIEIRKKILEECGVTETTVPFLVKYEIIGRMRVALVKADGLIPGELDVAKHILSYSPDDIPPIDLLAAGEKRYRGGSIRGDSWPLVDLHRYAILHYLVWFFNDEKIFQMRRFLKPVSFRNVLQTLKLLESKILLSKKQIRENMSLISCDPKTLSRLLKAYPKLGKEDLTKLIARYPKLALRSAAEVQAVLQCIKEWEFDERAVASCPSILTLDVRDLNKRLNVLKNVPEVWSLRHSQSVLRLLGEKDLLLKLEYFKTLPRKTIPTVSLLLGDDSSFKTALGRGRQIAPVRDFLRLLAAEFNTDTSTIRKSLSKHQFWKLGSCSQIMETLTLLRSRGYSDKDVFENIHILLYPRRYVEKTLNKEVLEAIRSEESPGLSTPKATELSLCLYFIERSHGFSGFGIFEGLGNVEKETVENTPRV